MTFLFTRIIGKQFKMIRGINESIYKLLSLPLQCTYTQKIFPDLEILQKVFL